MVPFADVFHAPYYAICANVQAQNSWPKIRGQTERLPAPRGTIMGYVPSGHYFLKWESRAGNGPDGEVSVWRSLQGIL